MQTPVPESQYEKAETSSPKLETHKESACEEVTEVSASLEPVASAAFEAHVAERAGRPTIDYRVLRDLVPLQQVLERICGVPVQTVQHRGPCPIHEPNATSGRKLSANLKRQVFRCFDPSCAVQGNVLDLWKAYKNSTSTKPPKTSRKPSESPCHTCHQGARNIQKAKTKNLAGITRPALDSYRYI